MQSATKLAMPSKDLCVSGKRKQSYLLRECKCNGQNFQILRRFFFQLKYSYPCIEGEFDDHWDGDDDGQDGNEDQKYNSNLNGCIHNVFHDHLDDSSNANDFNDRVDDSWNEDSEDKNKNPNNKTDIESLDNDDEYFNGADMAYNEGFNEGNISGIRTGFHYGSEIGYDTGCNAGYNDGYNDGYNTGYIDGYNEGFDDCCDDCDDDCDEDSKGYNATNYNTHDVTNNSGFNEESSGFEAANNAKLDVSKSDDDVASNVNELDLIDIALKMCVYKILSYNS